MEHGNGRRMAWRVTGMLLATLILTAIAVTLTPAPQARADTVTGCRKYYEGGESIQLMDVQNGALNSQTGTGVNSDCYVTQEMVTRTGDSGAFKGVTLRLAGWSTSQLQPMSADTYQRIRGNKSTASKYQLASTLTMPSNATTVYAVWVEGLTLTYDVNAPTGATAPATPAVEAVALSPTGNGKGTFTDQSGWKKGDTNLIPGYRFAGWYTAKDGGTAYQFGKEETNDVTVYAHWTPVQYTIKFNTNNKTAVAAGEITGSAPADMTMTVGESKNLNRQSYGYKHAGSQWTFCGWTLQPGTGWQKDACPAVQYADGASVSNLAQAGGTVTLYAQWKRSTMRLHYDANGGTGSYGPVSALTWDKVNVSRDAKGKFKKTDRVFVCWSKIKVDDNDTFKGCDTLPGGSTNRVAEGSNLNTQDTDITVYAVWRYKTNQGWLPLTGNPGGGLTVRWPVLLGELAALGALTGMGAAMAKRRHRHMPLHRQTNA